MCFADPTRHKDQSILQVPLQALCQRRTQQDLDWSLPATLLLSAAQPVASTPLLYQQKQGASCTLTNHLAPPWATEFPFHAFVLVLSEQFRGSFHEDGTFAN